MFASQNTRLILKSGVISIKHLGDITKISGYDAPVVDVIIGGSPCQDLSIAGGRKGLSGERSGLFMDQIRIVKEMRERDRRNGRAGEHIRPRFMVWENVPGAFSSNGGKDFSAVLEESIRVSEPEAPDVLVPNKGWPTSGCIYDEMGKWSVSWRVLDAQYWGVPQRRRRIALVADFGGLSAPEILFVRKSVSGDIEQGEQNRQETARYIGEDSVGSDTKFVVLENHPNDSRVKIATGGKFQTLSSRSGTGGGNVPMIMEPVSCRMDVGFFNSIQECSHTILDRGYKDQHIINSNRIVRRITPLECERLQGFPDGWTDIGEWVDSKGKKHKLADSPRYKALGNSIAIPPWKWVIKRLCSCYERDATMASLFDGIGGFPLIWEQINGKGSCLWASEIEEFPIAVTKRRFCDEDRPY